jgi:hypothetical protein
MMKFLRALPEAVDKRPDEARQVLRAALVGPVKCFPAATPGGHTGSGSTSTRASCSRRQNPLRG